MAYSRDNVQTHSEMGRERHPAVNVKVRDWWPRSHTDDMLRRIATEQGYDPDAFTAWWHATAEKCAGANAGFDFEWLQPWWDAVAEQAWEDFEEIASEVFPTSVEVYSEGRSSGWLVVHRLPDIEEWDAVALGRWRRFERLCRSLCDETYVAERITELVLINRFDAEITEAAVLDAEVDKWATLAGATA